MSSYKITYIVNNSISPQQAKQLSSFLSSFYATSDDPSAHEKYAREYFTTDATLVMGSAERVARGFDGMYIIHHLFTLCVCVYVYIVCLFSLGFVFYFCFTF